MFVAYELPLNACFEKKLSVKM